MATIKRFPVLNHLRSEPSRHVIHYSRGRRRRSGRGLAFWFRPMLASIVEIPCDDRELPFLVHARSNDFQDITVQGSVTWRAMEPEVLAERLDFTIDQDRGTWREEPLQQVSEMLTHLVQRFASDFLAQRDVHQALADGVEVLRRGIGTGLAGFQALKDMGLTIVEVVVSKASPTAELEKALQTPALEGLQQQADEAVFRRRALAVDKERAIAENELANQIELATREADLIDQRGQNEQRRARETAQAQQIENEAAAERTRLGSEAQAASIRAVEEARVGAERERMELVEGLEPHVLLGLAAREFAGKLQNIEHLNLAPDMLGQLFGDLLRTGTQRLATAAVSTPSTPSTPSSPSSPSNPSVEG